MGDCEVGRMGEVARIQRNEGSRGFRGMKDREDRWGDIWVCQRPGKWDALCAVVYCYTTLHYTTQQPTYQGYTCLPSTNVQLEQHLVRLCKQSVIQFPQE